MNQVPATTAVRRNRVGNIDTNRLIRRRNHLINMLIVNGGRNMAGGRMAFGHRAAELAVIRRTLVSRGVISATADAAMIAAAANSQAVNGLL